VINDRGEKEKIWTHKVVEDAHVVWQPDKKKNLRVSIRNIETVITQIAERVPVDIVTYDRWNSAGSIETLAVKGITATAHNITRDDYDLLKGTIYAGDIELLTDQLTEYELTQLRRTEGGKVDHPEGGSKDLADALAGITRLILRDKKMLQKVRAKSIGMPRPTAAFGHGLSGDFNLGEYSGGAGGASPLRSLKSREMVTLPDVPPMPFGIGSSGRPRPRTRGLVGSSNSSNEILSDKLIGRRIKELM